MIKKKQTNNFNFNAKILTSSKNIYGSLTKNTNFKLRSYIYGLRLKYVVLNYKLLKNSLLKNFKLISYFLKKKKNILIIGNAHEISFFMNDPLIQDFKNIFLYQQSWVNGILTNQDPQKLIKNNNIQLIIFLKDENKEIYDIINEIHKLEIPFISFLNSDFKDIQKMLYPIITNFSYLESIYFILYLLKKIIFQYATLSTKK